ncbi:hypothetical protein SBADM41S_04406 [Streptomyces badius]
MCPPSGAGVETDRHRVSGDRHEVPFLAPDHRLEHLTAVVPDLLGPDDRPRSPYGTGGRSGGGAWCHWLAGTHQSGNRGQLPGVTRSVRSEAQVSRTDWSSARTNSTASGSPARPSGR